MDLQADFAVFCIILFTAVGTMVICQTVPYQTPWPFIENRRIPNQSQSTGRQVSNDVRSDQVSVHNNGNVQDEELREFSENLLQRDHNNLARYTTVYYQGKTTSRSQRDEAPHPLLEVHRDAYNIPTVEKLLQLVDNYIAESNIPEEVTNQERQEENSFLDKLMETQVMEYTRNFLIQKGIIGNNPQEFRNILKEIWFTMYPRGGRKLGSSGFEHVFVGELKNGEVSGLHNWLYYSIAESNRLVNYLGYMKKVELGNKGSILKYHFKRNEVDKPVASMFIGTSPELEIALYSTCFLLRADRVCPLKLGGNNFIIRTFKYQYQGKSLIGSAFPEI